jgi:lipoteichoic acid synthase
MAEVHDVSVPQESAPARGLLAAVGSRVLGRLTFLVFVAALVGKGFVLAQAVGHPVAARNFPLCSTLAAVALGAPLLLLRGRAQALGLLALDLLVSVLFLGDALSLRAYGDVLSAASLAYADQLGHVGDAVVGLLEGRDALFFADLPLLLVLALVPARARSRLLPSSRGRWVAAVVVAAVALVVLAERTDSTRDQLWYGHSRWVARYGPLTYHVVDAAQSIRMRFQADPVPPEVAASIRALAAEARRTEPGELAGAARGLNLLVVQVESLQGFTLGMEVGGTAVTPNLNRLATESLHFTNFYHQAGVGRTADADFLLHCSLHPLPTSAVYFEYAENEFRCLPRLLAAAGYRPHAFQGIHADFWNLAAVYPRLGFERYHSLRDYRDDGRIGIGLADASFLRQTTAKLEALPQPFYAFVTTLSSHAPFDFPEIPKALPLGVLADTSEGAFLDALHYADAALGRFVDELRAGGLLDRTLLVVYGDHDGIYNRPKNVAELIGSVPQDPAAWMDLERRVPLLLRFPGGAHAGTHTAPGGQLDLAPTLLRLLGVENPPAAFLGRDLLAAPGTPRTVILPGGAAIGEALRWFPPGRLSGREDGYCVDAVAGELPPERCADLAERARAELAASEAVIRGNLAAALADAPLAAGE